jgi:hypothetical protein
MFFDDSQSCSNCTHTAAHVKDCRCLCHSADTTGPEPQTVRYTVTLTLTRACEEGYVHVLTDYNNPTERRRIEKEIIKTCSRLDGDVDCEVIDTELLFDKEM